MVKCLIIKLQTMNWIKEIAEKRRQKEREKDLINRRESAMTNLLAGLETEDAINTFEEVSELFHRAMQKRLERIKEETNNIERFLYKSE